MSSNRETIETVHEAMQAAICVVTTLHAAGCLLGAGHYPRGTGEAGKVEYLVRRVAAWIRLFADHVSTLDRAMDLPGESVAAVSAAVVVERVHVDSSRFDPYLSATAASLALIADARLSGDGLLKCVARIIESKERNVYRPDVLRDHASKLEAMELDVWYHCEELSEVVKLHEQAAKSFSAKWQPMAIPLEVERLMIGREENHRPDDPWIRIDAPADLIGDSKFIGDQCNGSNSDLIKREIINPGAKSPRYRYRVRRSAIAKYVKPDEVEKYKSRSE